MWDPYDEYKRTGKTTDEIAGFGQSIILLGCLLLVGLLCLMLINLFTGYVLGWDFLGMLPVDCAEYRREHGAYARCPSGLF